MKYIRPLDGLRAIAVSLVLIWHWLPKTYWINYVRTGPLGVDVFYVLSGFLITSILLQQRQDVEDGKSSRKNLMIRFYARRVLRIFPIYYLLIAAMILFRHVLSIPLGTKETVAALTYTSNFYIFSAGAWPSYTLHFWSLSVEEQFYLLWPWLLVFLPRKQLLPCLFLLTLTGIVSRLFTTNGEFGALQTFACFDSLGLGALLAWVCVHRPLWIKKIYPTLSLLAFGSAVVLIWDAATVRVWLREERLLDSLIGVWAVCFIITAHQSKNFFIAALSSKPMVNIGRISYGVYLYHVAFGWQAWRVWKRLTAGGSVLHQPWLDCVVFLVDAAVLFALCSLSWVLIEKPMLKLKKRVAYEPQPEKATTVSVLVE